MNKRTMSIAQGLSELTMLSKKIDKIINNTMFCAMAKKKSKEVKNQRKEDFQKDVKSSYESLQDLIENRRRIKNAIEISNATTIVTVGGIEMTVSEAIDRKRSLTIEEGLLSEMRNQYSICQNELDKTNEKVEMQGNAFIENMLGSEKSKTEDALKLLNNYLEEHSYELVDPLNILKEIERLIEYVDTYSTEINYVLTESNVKTLITV